MNTLAVVTGEKHFFKPFELFPINEKLQLLICRCPFKFMLLYKFKKLHISGYIGEDAALPVKRVDGSGVFSFVLPTLIKRLIKLKDISTNSVAIVSGGNDSIIAPVFANIAHMFRDFYIISTDYEYITDQAERFFSDYGIAIHTDEPADMCDVEIFVGSDFCGIGHCVLNYNTDYEIKHGYNLPIKIDSRAFVEVLIEYGIITIEQLKGLEISLRGIDYD